MHKQEAQKKWLAWVLRISLIMPTSACKREQRPGLSITKYNKKWIKNTTRNYNPKIRQKKTP